MDLQNAKRCESRLICLAEARFVPRTTHDIVERYNQRTAGVMRVGAFIRYVVRPVLYPPSSCNDGAAQRVHPYRIAAGASKRVRGRLQLRERACPRKSKQTAAAHVLHEAETSSLTAAELSKCCEKIVENDRGAAIRRHRAREV